jgi:uncharacterized protein (DUF2267 family)
MLNKINKYAEDAQQFFKCVAVETGHPEDTDQAFRVTKAVLHTLRDRITPEESLHLIAQLPLILKGIYVDGWKIRKEVPSMDHISQFLEAVRNHQPGTEEKDFPDDQQTLNHVFAVLRIMRTYVDAGESEDIAAQLPRPLAALFV